MMARKRARIALAAAAGMSGGRATVDRWRI
jgi:hypothetical protein